MEIVEKLIKANANIDEKDNNGMTDLMMAIKKNKVEVVEKLIEASANVNAKDNMGRTALIHASMRNKVEIVEKLIEASANVNEKDNMGRTALMYTNDGLTGGWMTVSTEKQVEVVKKLIKAGANINEKDKYNDTVLMHTSRVEVVDILIEAGANVHEKNICGWTVLMKTLQVKKAQSLIKAGANVNEKDSDGRTALMHISNYGFTGKKIVEELIKAGANVHEKDKNGQTALVIAGRYINKTEVLESLIEAGANVNEKDNNGWTALMMASRYNNREEVVESLLKAGANVNEKKKDGKTALMMASGYNKTEVVESLLKAGANINEKDKNGQTALMYANEKNRMEIVESLLKAGVNINEKKKDGKRIKESLNEKIEIELVNDLDYVFVKEAKSMPELSLQLMKINEGMKSLGPVLLKKVFWREALRNIIGNSAMTFEEICNNEIFLFLNEIDYKEVINSVLNDDNYFKKVNLYGAYARAENKNYFKLKTLSEEVEHFLNSLNINQEIVFQRRILKNDTLERVGRNIRLTKTGAGHIEVKIRERLNAYKIQLIFRPYFQYIMDFFEKQKKQVFNSEEFNYYISSKNQHFGEFGFDLIDFFNATNNLDKKVNRLFDKYLSMLTIEEIDKIFYKIFENQNFMSEDDFYLNLQKHLILNKNFIDDYIANSSNMEKIDEIVMYKNYKITSGDKIELIFKTKDISLKIGELINLYKKYFGVELTERAMLATLQRNPEKFIRVFMGTYSLSEWEIENHMYIMVKDLIVECLREAKKPLHYSEIATYVKQKTRANENIFKYNNGYTALKEWEDDEELSRKYSLSEWGMKNHIAVKDFIIEYLREARKRKKIYKNLWIDLIVEYSKETIKHEQIYKNLEIDLIVECLREVRRPLDYSGIASYIKQKTKANEYDLYSGYTLPLGRFTSNKKNFKYSHDYTTLKEWYDDGLYGRYTLSEWGMKNHLMVKNLIVECLREAKKPLHYLEIATYVKQKTKVNENAMRIFKSDDKIFKYNNGYTALTEWEEYEKDSNRAIDYDMKKESHKVGIVENTINVNEKNKYGQTALMCAITKNQVEVIENIIKAGANVNEKDNYGWTALIYSSERNQADVVEKLIKAGANVNEKNKYGQTALMCAIEKNQVEVIEILIKAGAEY